MTPNHTPGPWHVEHQGGLTTVCTGPVNGRGIRVAYIASPAAERPLLVEEANARLIACAPEGLALARAVLDAVNTHWETSVDARAWLDTHLATLARAIVTRTKTD